MNAHNKKIVEMREEDEKEDEVNVDSAEKDKIEKVQVDKKDSSTDSTEEEKEYIERSSSCDSSGIDKKENGCDSSEEEKGNKKESIHSYVASADSNINDSGIYHDGDIICNKKEKIIEKDKKEKSINDLIVERVHDIETLLEKDEKIVIIFFNGEEIDVVAENITLTHVKVIAAHKLKKFAPDIIAFNYKDGKQLDDDSMKLSKDKHPKISVIMKELYRDHEYYYRALKKHNDVHDADGVRRIVEEMSDYPKYNYLETCLMIASRYGFSDVVKALLDNTKIKINVNCTDDRGYTSLCLATLCGSIDTVQYLIEARVSLDCGGGSQLMNPLCFASFYGKTTIMKMLIESYAHLEYKEEIQRTPLHLAIIQDQFESCKLLLDARGNMHNPDGKGNNALTIAEKKQGQILELFQKYIYINQINLKEN